MSTNLLEILQTTRGLLLSSSWAMTEASDADINQSLTLTQHLNHAKSCNFGHVMQDDVSCILKLFSLDCLALRSLPQTQECLYLFSLPFLIVPLYYFTARSVARPRSPLPESPLLPTTRVSRLVFASSLRRLASLSNASFPLDSDPRSCPIRPASRLPPWLGVLVYSPCCACFVSLLSSAFPLRFTLAHTPTSAVAPLSYLPMSGPLSRLAVTVIHRVVH
jgi:hypothetical protein